MATSALSLYSVRQMNPNRVDHNLNKILDLDLLIEISDISQIAISNIYKFIFRIQLHVFSFYKYNVYKHIEAQISKKLSITKHISEPHYCISTVKIVILP